MAKEEKLSPMQQELLSRADSIFDSIKGAVLTAKDFAVEQLPDIAQQIIALERAYLTTIFILPFIIVPFLIFFIWKHTKINNLRNSSGDTWAGILAVPFAAATILSTVALIINFKEFLTVWFAPKIFLIQYISEMIKSKL